MRRDELMSEWRSQSVKIGGFVSPIRCRYTCMKTAADVIVRRELRPPEDKEHCHYRILQVTL